MTKYWNVLCFIRIQISTPPPLLYRKCDFVFRCAPRAYSNLNIEFISHVYIDHSLRTNTIPSKHDDHLLHQIYFFYCNSTKKSVFPNFCATCDGKNGLKFFWSKMVEIGSITFSITYFSQFLAVYHGMWYYILEQVNCYGFKDPKNTLSRHAYPSFHKRQKSPEKKRRIKNQTFKNSFSFVLIQIHFPNISSFSSWLVNEFSSSSHFDTIKTFKCWFPQNRWF